MITSAALLADGAGGVHCFPVVAAHAASGNKINKIIFFVSMSSSPLKFTYDSPDHLILLPASRQGFAITKTIHSVAK